jgi:hypothetical protein
MHPYSSNGPESWHTLNWMKTLQERLYSSPLTSLLPIVITEWSYLAPKSVSSVDQANWQSRIPLIAPFLVDTFAVFYGIQAPTAFTDPSEGSAGLLDPLGASTETYRRFQFLAPHVAGSTLVGRLAMPAGDAAWTVLMRTPQGKPTLVTWSRDVSTATPLQSGLPTYQAGRSPADFQTVSGTSLSSLVATGTPLVVSSTAADPLWGPISTIGRLPTTLNIGYSKAREQVVRQIYDALFGSALLQTAQIEIRSGAEALAISMDTLRRSSFQTFEARLEAAGVTMGEFAEVERPLSLSVKLPDYAAVKFDLGANAWPGNVRYQFRTLEPNAVLLGTKHPRISMLAGVKLAGGLVGSGYTLQLSAGETTFSLGMGSSEGKRNSYRMAIMEGKVVASYANDPPRDVRILSFADGGPAYNQTLPMNQIWNKGTCTLEKLPGVTSPAGTMDSLRISGTTFIAGVLRITYGPGTLTLPTGTKRIDMWVFPKGPVRQVDLSVRDLSGKVYFMPKQVRVVPGQWNLVQMQVPQVAGGTTILHDIFRVFPEPGALATDIDVTLGEIRVYAS